jgi:hypothetical protein
MTENESFQDEEMLDAGPDTSGETAASHVIRLLRTYGLPILLTLVVVCIGYLLLALLYAVMAPVQRSTVVGFRLEFPGAANGEYPNGLKFTGSDIVDTPILRAAYDANQLDRYMTFADFSRSIVVLVANDALRQLASEYESKLNNPKLSPVERERLEAEYRQKQESLRKSDYALTLTTREGFKKVPPSVSAKTLADILRFWADFAAKSRQVIVHRIPLVSAEAATRLGLEDPDVFSSLLALRAISVELGSNIRALMILPGAELIRSSRRNASLREIELELAQLQRGSIEFLVTDFLRSGKADRSHTAAIIESQLAYDRRSLEAAEENVRVLRTALDDYTQTTQESNALTPASAEKTAGAETVVLSETFLEKIVSLSKEAADSNYRQSQISEIKAAALTVVPLRQAVAYEENLLSTARSGASAATQIPDITAERNRIASKLSAIAADLYDIRSILSRSLGGSGQLYTITSPAVTVVERSVSVSRLMLGGILVLLSAAVIAIAAAVVRDILLRENRRRTTGNM